MLHHVLFRHCVKNILFGFMRLLQRFYRSHCRTLVSVYWFCLACVSDLFCVRISFSFIQRWPPFDVSTFEFISSLYFNLSSRQREGVTDAEMPAHWRSLPAGLSEGQAGTCCSVSLLPPLCGSPGVRLLYMPPDATFVPTRRSPLRAGL